MNPFNYIPLTFSLNFNDIDFYDELQNYSKYFLSIEKGCKPEEIHHISYIIDTKGKEKDVYFDFSDIVKPSKIARSRFRPSINLSPDKIKANSNYFNKNKNLWMIKPSGLSRARGIELFNKLEDLKFIMKKYKQGFDQNEFLNEQKSKNSKISKGILLLLLLDESKFRTHSLPPKENKFKKKKNQNEKKIVPGFIRSSGLIVQKYLESPLLYQNRKFDIRVLTLLDHEMKVYVFKYLSV